MNLSELRAKSIKKITEDIDELSGAQLVELRALEQAEDAPRATLIHAIDEKLTELGATAPASVAATIEPTAPPAWQAPDYCGAMSGDQAEWRNANLKPVRGVVTK